MNNRHTAHDNLEQMLKSEQFEFGDEEEIRPELNIAPKDRKLVTHPYDFIIRSLADQIEDDTLILADKFQ